MSLEFFTSQFRHVQILGSTTYPTQKWRLLDEVELSVSETHQVFNIKPRCGDNCWVQFLKIRVLSHYSLDQSNYCALTKLQVFGSTVLKELDKQMKEAEIREQE